MTQVFYATHSPYFIDLAQFDKIRVARKCPTEGSDVSSVKNNSIFTNGGSGKIGCNL